MAFLLCEEREVERDGVALNLVADRGGNLPRERETDVLTEALLRRAGEGLPTGRVGVGVQRNAGAEVRERLPERPLEEDVVELRFARTILLARVEARVSVEQRYPNRIREFAVAGAGSRIDRLLGLRLSVLVVFGQFAAGPDVAGVVNDREAKRPVAVVVGLDVVELLADRRCLTVLDATESLTASFATPWYS